MRLLILALIFFSGMASAQTTLLSPVEKFSPLQVVALRHPTATQWLVKDGGGRTYATGKGGWLQFTTGGMLGRHSIHFFNAAGKVIDSTSFIVEAATTIDDNKGAYSRLFHLLYQGMNALGAAGTEWNVRWRGQTVPVLVSWVLDNYHTLKGEQYFKPHGKNLVDIMRVMQKDDGTIFSFIANNEARWYFQTAYDKWGFFKDDGDAYFARQPVENHVEYCYVSTIYKAWKGSGDDEWMRSMLPSAIKAMNYVRHSGLRWSKRFNLLKRALTIDSWDFQVEDEYTPQLGLGNWMLVDSNKTKFGIFYGDNQGYALACSNLAEMLKHTGDVNRATEYQQLGKELDQRMDALGWNGKFYTHFIEEDSTVVRKLGVDVSKQFSQSNAYAINRGIDHQKAKAIIESYQQFRKNLPVGSPGEWYTIYPPYEKGFGTHNEKWQYMNGGVAAHAAGELALGAFQLGYESYGAHVLQRILHLGEKWGDGKVVYFAYTGSTPPPPPVQYKTIAINSLTNKDYKEQLPNMPTGAQRINNIPFAVPGSGGAVPAIAISGAAGYSKELVVPINDTCQTLYLLHTGMGKVTDDLYASIGFMYADGSERNVYVKKEKHVTNWWFPTLKTDVSGVAWHGPNKESVSVGTWWAAIENPEPTKKITSLRFAAVKNDAVYNVFGITLADQPHYVAPKPQSYGGPDNWSAATNMAALIEGQAGVTDAGIAFSKPIIAPRWIAAGRDTVSTVVKYAASNGYVAYNFLHKPGQKQIALIVTGSANTAHCHLLIPKAAQVTQVTVGVKTIPFQMEKIEQSAYADFDVPLTGAQTVVVTYRN